MNLLENPEEYEEVDFFMMNYSVQDPDIVNLWFKGHTTHEVITLLREAAFKQGTNSNLEFITGEVLDHYRGFTQLERLLHRPSRFAEQTVFQMEDGVRQRLIARYYELDDSVLRELLGLRLTSKIRKDLDEVAEKTGVRLRSCRRQFDNLRRIFRCMEEVPGNLEANIQDIYELPLELARRYGVVVFFSCLGFDLSKEKLEHLTFEDFYHCGRAMMVRWTYTCTGPEYYDTEIDREFMMDLRECRVLIDNEEEHKKRCCTLLSEMMTPAGFEELELNFRTYSRVIIELAYGLHRSREFKHFFSDCFEKCVEPLRNSKWSKTEVRDFLTVYQKTATEIEAMRTVWEGELIEIWHRFMDVAIRCIITMY